MTARLLPAALVACVLLQFGCGSDSSTTDSGQGSPASRAATGGAVTIASAYPIASIDPYKWTLLVESYLFPVLWTTLVQYESDSGFELEAGLAESWSSSDDARVHTFKLRSAKFSNGDPITARDAAVSIRKYVDPETGSHLSFFPAIERVEATDPSTVTITTEEPSPGKLLTMLRWMPIMPAAQTKGEFPKQPVTSGPFQVEEFAPDDHLTVVPNPNFWGEAPPADELRFVRASDQAAAVTGVRSKDLDVLWDAPVADLESLQADGVKIVLGEPPAAQAYLNIDTAHPPFDDPKVRQALVHATDKERINEVVYAGTLQVTQNNVPFADSDPLFNSAVEDYPFDLERAKQLFAEAGVTELTFWALGGQKDQQLLAQVLQDDLKKIGIDLRIETKPQAEWFEKLTPVGADWGGMIIAQAPIGSVPSPYYLSVWLPGQCLCNYDSKTFNSTVKRAETEADPERERELWAEVQQIVHDEVPAVIIGMGSTPIAVRPEVDGVWQDPATVAHFEDAHRVDG